MRYTPFESFDRVLDQLRHDMVELQRSMGENWPAERLGLGTGIDLAEHDDEFVLTVDLPGFDREEIDLRYHDGVLWLTAEHEADDETGTRRRSMREQVAIGREVDVDGIEASYHNGVLEVRLPVLEGAAERGHRIEID